MELCPESRKLTTFHVNGRLYRYKRLSMGLAPARGEINASLTPLFAHLDRVHVIHDDILIEARDINKHNSLLRQALKIIDVSGVTLNPKKCVFGVKEVQFWGLRINEHGVQPDPQKVDTLKYTTQT